MSYSVLIVDDNLSLANLYEVVFERFGCRVRRLSSGAQALDSIAADVPDVVLLDIMMPEMDGVEVCRRLRQLRPERPPWIVIYTANNRPEVRETSLAAGADVFYTKSMSVFDLPARIAEHLPRIENNESEIPR
jgi:two-component system alkaline phosphatase synthesis response regulator PhoP/two-component system response regulator ResD